MAPDLQTQLRAYADQLEGEAPPLDDLLPDETLAVPSPPGKRKRPRWITALAGALLVLIVIGGAGLLRSLQPPAPPATTLDPGEPAVAPEELSVTEGWIRLDLDPDTSGEGSISDVTEGGPGLVAVGMETAQGGLEIAGATVWTSSDGLSWTRLPRDEEVFPPGSQLAAVTAGGPGLVAVGTVPAEEGDPARDAAIWVSEDGISWQRIPHDPALFGGYEQVWDVVSGPGGLVAVGTRFREGFETTVWSSLQGLDWEQVAVLEGARLTDLAVGGPGLVATGSVLSEEAGAFVVGMWASEDGRAWALVHRDDEASAFGTEVIAAGGPGLVAIGGYPAAVWTSPDGTDWTKRAELEGAEVRTLTTGGPGLVAAGVATEEGAQAAVVWASEDGTTWSRVPHDEALFGGGSILGLTAGGPGLVAVGSVFTDREAPAIWVWDPLGSSGG